MSSTLDPCLTPGTANETLVSNEFKSYLETLWGTSFQLKAHETHPWEWRDIQKALYSSVSHQKGRTVVCARQKPFQMGEVLWTEPEPYAFVLLEKYLTMLCSFCLVRLEKRLQCSGCSFVSYCSQSCQRADWTDHMGECKPLKEHPWPSPVRLIARAIRKKRRESNNDSQVKEKATWSMALELCAHPLDKNLEEMFGLMSVGVRHLLRNDLSDLTPTHLMQFFALLRTNGLSAFSTSQGLQPAAQALYVATSLVNHSCDPNTQVTFDGRQLVLKCLKPIQPGDEIFISYLDPCQTKKARQKELLESYRFQCQCSRCEKETSDNADEETLPMPSPLSIEEMEKLEARCIDHDLRLQPIRIELLYELKRPNRKIDFARQLSLSKRVHATYVHHLGPFQLMSVFHELDTLELSFLYLQQDFQKQRWESLKQQFNAWLPKAHLWFTEKQLQQLRVFCLQRGIFEYLCNV